MDGISLHGQRLIAVVLGGKIRSLDNGVAHRWAGLPHFGLCLFQDVARLNAKAYLILFRRKSDRYAEFHGFFDGRDMTYGEVTEMIDHVTAELKREQKLSDLEHETFKDMMRELAFGKGRGRK